MKFSGTGSLLAARWRSWQVLTNRFYGRYLLKAIGRSVSRSRTVKPDVQATSKNKPGPHGRGSSGLGSVDGSECVLAQIRKASHGCEDHAAPGRQPAQRIAHLLGQPGKVVEDEQVLKSSSVRSGAVEVSVEFAVVMRQDPLSRPGV